MPKPKSFAQLFLDQEAKEEKVVKKRKMNKVDYKDESKMETSGVVFDEVLAFKDDGAKFSHKIKFSPEMGLGLKGDKIYIFRVYKKENIEEISKYQFGFNVSTVEYLKCALDKMMLHYKN